MSTEDGPEPAAAPGRIALRSPLEAFLWIFITRLIALVTASRVALPPDATAGDATDAPDTGSSTSPDPARARRVGASRPPADANRPPADPSASASERRPAAPDATSRAVAVTAAASVVAGAAAFAAGRRRGRR